MPNEFIYQRLQGILDALTAVHKASSTLSASSRGTEREQFVSEFLERVFPPIYRFGSGDVTNSKGKRSGQLDVVIEYPFAPSFPGITSKQPTRLYVAEGVAAVLEVKSDVSAQWSEVERTAAQLAKLERHFGEMMLMGDHDPGKRIPLFAIGYKGWKTPASLYERIKANPNVAGILVIDPPMMVSTVGGNGIGPAALWAFIDALYRILASVQAAHNDPLKYMFDIS